MDNQYYIYQNEQTLGPYSKEEIIGWYNEGSLDTSVYVYVNDDWQAIAVFVSNSELKIEYEPVQSVPTVKKESYTPNTSFNQLGKKNYKKEKSRSKLPVVPVLLILILAAAGFFIYTSFFGDKYGINDSNPLGRFEKLEKYFINEGLVKDKVTKQKIPNLDITADAHHFIWKIKMGRTAGYLTEDVILFVDENNKIKAVGASIAPLDYMMAPIYAHSIAKKVMAEYWKKISGVLPKFNSKTFGRGIFKKSFLEAEYDGDKIKGFWKKTESPPSSMAVLYLK